MRIFLSCQQTNFDSSVVYKGIDILDQLSYRITDVQ
jgi:hypothetical protein